MLKPLPRTLLGALVGLIGLIGMTRLVGAGFPGNPVLAMIVVAAAMLPWVAYAGWRARHGHLSLRAALAVFLIGLAGLIAVWWGTVGPVLGLVCSLAGFVIIWIHDLPARRPPARRLVRIDDLSDADESGR